MKGGDERLCTHQAAEAICNKCCTMSCLGLLKLVRARKLLAGLSASGILGSRCGMSTSSSSTLMAMTTGVSDGNQQAWGMSGTQTHCAEIRTGLELLT